MSKKKLIALLVICESVWLMGCTSTVKPCPIIPPLGIQKVDVSSVEQMQNFLLQSQKEQTTTQEN